MASMNLDHFRQARLYHKLAVWNDGGVKSDTIHPMLVKVTKNLKQKAADAPTEPIDDPVLEGAANGALNKLKTIGTSRASSLQTDVKKIPSNAPPAQVKKSALDILKAGRAKDKTAADKAIDAQYDQAEAHINTLPESAQAPAAGAFVGAMTAVVGVWGDISGAFGDIANAIESFISNVEGTLKNVLNTIENGVESGVNAIGGFFKSL